LANRPLRTKSCPVLVGFSVSMIGAILVFEQEIYR
jgi:hypothetical protein